VADSCYRLNVAMIYGRGHDCEDYLHVCTSDSTKYCLCDDNFDPGFSTNWDYEIDSDTTVRCKDSGQKIDVSSCSDGFPLTYSSVDSPPSPPPSPPAEASPPPSCSPLSSSCVTNSECCSNWCYLSSCFDLATVTFVEYDGGCRGYNGGAFNNLNGCSIYFTYYNSPTDANDLSSGYPSDPCTKLTTASNADCLQACKENPLCIACEFDNRSPSGSYCEHWYTAPQDCIVYNDTTSPNANYNCHIRTQGFDTDTDGCVTDAWDDSDTVLLSSASVTWEGTIDATIETLDLVTLTATVLTLVGTEEDVNVTALPGSVVLLIEVFTTANTLMSTVTLLETTLGNSSAASAALGVDVVSVEPLRYAQGCARDGSDDVCDDWATADWSSFAAEYCALLSHSCHPPPTLRPHPFRFVRFSQTRTCTILRPTSTT
jgi:hypothetical protein